VSRITGEYAARIDWLAWWQLLRVANVFTAASNVIAGVLLVQHGWQPTGPLLLAVLASALLYEAGMVLNDVCDSELDAVERPERPIPSGRVSRKNALRVGVALLIGGIFTAHVVTWLTSQWQTIQIAFVLAATIVTYNAGVKSTRWGPLAMGGCRMMNVLLGASVGDNLSTLTGHPETWLLAAGIGIYTVGITLIARREAKDSVHSELIAGSVFVLGGLLAIALLPFCLETIAIPLAAWITIYCLLFAVTGNVVYQLLIAHSPFLGAAVGTFIQVFILIDAAVCALAAGWFAGAIVLCFFFPMRWIARWTPMT
jgi:hypothetical protein